MEKTNQERSHEVILYIKNMVCPRCIKVVREELESLRLNVIDVELGFATIETKPEVQEADIKAVLARNGFELLYDKRDELVENIKLTIIDLIYNEKLPQLNTNISTYLSENLNKDYVTISKIFKASENVALNKYIVVQKIERVKELLEYNEHNLSEIAYKLGYKSLQHLSSQFKEITGISTNEYKKLERPIRKPINEVT